jgi:hypothetical protein
MEADKVAKKKRNGLTCMRNMMTKIKNKIYRKNVEFRHPAPHLYQAVPIFATLAASRGQTMLDLKKNAGRYTFPLFLNLNSLSNGIWSEFKGNFNDQPDLLVSERIAKRLLCGVILHALQSRLAGCLLTKKTLTNYSCSAVHMNIAYSYKSLNLHFCCCSFPCWHSAATFL